MSYKLIALGDICTITGGGTPSKSNPSFYEGDIYWATVRDMSNDVLSETDFKISIEAVKESSTNIIPKGNVVIATRVGLGKVCILNQDTAINQDLRGVIPKNVNQLDVKYLFYWFKSISQKIIDAGRGATVHGVTLPFIKSLEIPLPSLATQQKIVAKLDAIFTEIDKALLATEANIKNSEALVKTILSNELDGSKNNWECKNLSDLAHQDCSLSYGIVQPGDEFSNGLPIVRPTDLTEKYISKINLKRINPELADSYKRTTLTGHELLLCVRGTTGTTSVSTSELKGCNVTRGIVPIRFRNDLIDLNYAYYFFKSDFLQRQIKEKTYGAALLQINISELRKLKITYPDLSEQLKIVERLDIFSRSIDTMTQAYFNKMKSLESLRKSTLEQAFNGELVKD